MKNCFSVEAFKFIYSVNVYWAPKHQALLNFGNTMEKKPLFSQLFV